jgi:hypothetical protein
MELGFTLFEIGYGAFFIAVGILCVGLASLWFLAACLDKKINSRG